MASERSVPVFVALDVASGEQAQDMVARLGSAGTHYKVGLELFLAAGNRLVSELVAQGKHVFLDLKFHDIPNTVRAAVREACKLGVDFVTVHAQGGQSMLEAAQESANAVNQNRTQQTQVLAVTLLTSLAPADLLTIGQQSDDPEQGVLRLAKLAQAAGLHGVVCSPQELQIIRQQTNLAAMVPGIRMQQANTDDQQRVATPAAAVHAGASYLVIGRPVLKAHDPLQALLTIQAEIRNVNM
jgi:orotidine-5'-phosphate decarboxylase